MILTDNFSEKIFTDFEFKPFRNSSVCILGGSGFIGTWLVSALNYLNSYHDCRITLTVFTRDRESTQKKFPNNQFPDLFISEYDFLNGKTYLGDFDFIVNGSTPTSIKPGHFTKGMFFSPTVNAIESIIYTVRTNKKLTNVVNLSSGAVYGGQSLSLPNQPEKGYATESTQLDEYASAKIKSEQLLLDSELGDMLKTISPRLFAFYGPGLPLDKHFAIGNFLKDGLDGRTIRILGNQDTRRSYMFPTDLVRWLMKALLDPKQGDFNIGSEKSISLFDLATLVSALTCNKGVEMLNCLEPASNYVPATTNFRHTYKVDESVDLREGLGWWIDWLRSQR